MKKWRNENFSPDSGLKTQVVFLFTGFFNGPIVPYFPYFSYFYFCPLFLLFLDSFMYISDYFKSS